MRILVTGDSLIARHEGLDQPMIDYYLKKVLPDLEISNTAVSGSNTADLLENLPTFFPTADFEMVFILIGTNDLALNKQLPLKKFQKNLVKILQENKKIYPASRICLISPPAVDESKQKFRNNHLIAHYSCWMQRSAELQHSEFIDLQQMMQNQPNFLQLTQGSLNDGLHFGKRGYLLLASLIKEQLAFKLPKIKITEYYPESPAAFSS